MRVLLAGLIAMLLGLEREWAAKDAGLRTNVLVAMGSATFTVLSLEAFPGPGDEARVAAQVVTGVGFLGAGVVWRSARRARGITTAATIWVVAAVGMAAGAGFLALAVVLAVAAWLVLVGLARLERWLHRTDLVSVEDVPGERAEVPADGAEGKTDRQGEDRQDQRQG